MMKMPAWVSKTKTGGQGLLVACMAMSILGCTTLDLKMQQDVAPGPSCQGACDPGCKPCPKCPKVDCPDDSRGVIEILDPAVVAWIPLNSTFTQSFADSDGDPHAVRNGVLIQLGAYGLNHDEPDPGDFFYKLSIDGNDYCIPDSDRCATGLPVAEWINIVPAGSDPNDPMTESDLSFTNNAQGTTNLTDSFHEEFTARAVITYWMGESGYEIWVTGQDHPLQILSFGDDVDVYVHLEAATGDNPVEVVTHANVKRIEIHGPPGTNHGGYHDPAMGPRR